MKAPNKVYVLLDERVGFLSHTFTNVPCGYESSQDIEYIRKDALLEWLNERYKSTISNVGCYTGHSVWAEVIEHIDEM